MKIAKRLFLKGLLLVSFLPLVARGEKRDGLSGTGQLDRRHNFERRQGPIRGMAGQGKTDRVNRILANSGAKTPFKDNPLWGTKGTVEVVNSKAFMSDHVTKNKL